MFNFLKKMKFNNEKFYELSEKVRKLEDFIVSNHKPKFNKLEKVKMKDGFAPHRVALVVVGYKMESDYTYKYNLVSESGGFEFTACEYMIECKRESSNG